MLDNTNKFTGKAETYKKYRPNYGKHFINFLYNDYGFNQNSIIADIGSGTGIFSMQLLQRGSTVYAVEPNDDMRNAAQQQLNQYQNHHSINATAENTTLENNSIDFIVCTQSFHWFDKTKFKVECQRILKSNGKVVLAWNTKVETNPLVKEIEIIRQKYTPNYTKLGSHFSKQNNEISNFFNQKYKTLIFQNNLTYDINSFVGRELSNSRAPLQNTDNYNGFVSELKILFDKYADNNTLLVPNIVEVFISDE